jgi:hypothetical protein
VRRFTFALHEADHRLTAAGDDPGVWKAVLVASLASLALAAAGSAADLPAGWTHAEINYSVNRVPHTLVLDRGRVTAVSPAALTIREADGSSVQVALAPDTQIVVDGRPGQLSDLRRGVMAVTQRIDGGAARLVRVHVPPRLLRLARR